MDCHDLRGGRVGGILTPDSEESEDRRVAVYYTKTDGSVNTSRVYIAYESELDGTETICGYFYEEEPDSYDYVVVQRGNETRYRLRNKVENVSSSETIIGYVIITLTGDSDEDSEDSEEDH